MEPLQSHDSRYRPPQWARPPSAEWKLHEIKSGVQVATHSLANACILFGREEPSVDIVTSHASCSRQHARIAFDESGVAWIRDLQSTHGTFVNKRRIPPQACGKYEVDEATPAGSKPGARGVVLYPDDIVQFGASTRLYQVEGPEEQSRTAAKVRQIQAKQKVQHNQPKAPIHNTAVNAAVDGSEELSETDLTEERERFDRMLSKTSDSYHAGDFQIPDKHHKEWEKLQALAYKLQNIQTESDRIRQKGGNLTEGQEKQLQRNQERIKALEDELKKRKEELWTKLHPKDARQSSTSISAAQSAYQEEDEVDDRTTRTLDTNQDDAETEESLTRKFRQRFDEMQPMEINLQRFKAKADHLKTKIAALEANGDTEEAFFIQNDYNLVQEQVQKNEHELESIKESLKEIERLLRIINPKLFINCETGHVGLDPPAPPPSSMDFMMPPPPPPSFPRKATSAQDGGDSAFSMPPPASLSVKRPAEASDKGVASSPPHEDETGPAKRKRVLGPALPPPSTSTTAAISPSKGLVAKGPVPQGTLAILTASSLHQTTTTGDGQAPKQPPMPQTVLPPASNGKVAPATESDAKRDVWQAPKGQDGSGKTKLNEKFAGRY